MAKNKDNPNAFKLWINQDVVNRMADSLNQSMRDFNKKSFLKLTEHLEPLELKQRVQLICDELHKYLPQDFPDSIDILLKSLKFKKLNGFDLWPYTLYVQTYGQQHHETSMEALYQLTQLFTAEFAIRPFLRQETDKTLNYLKRCAVDKNVHIRRWSSEGSRPRLPWGEHLDVFIKNPKKTLPILELLKYDDELYVRKSVANHLNDIAKDHPKLVVDLLTDWNSKAPQQHLEKILWITKHALRSLIKQGSPGALKLIGVNAQAKIKTSGIKLLNSQLKINQILEFEITVQSTSHKRQKLVIDYIVHHQKSNGKQSPKVFKLKTFEIEPKQSVKIKKKHSLRPVSTRKYYPGQHAIEIQINGKKISKKDWVLK